MSRIGKAPITIKDSVQVNIEKGGNFGNLVVNVKGPKGELSQDIRAGITVEINSETNEVVVTRKSNAKLLRGYHGLYRTLISNMIEGVVNGFSKELEIHGVGYRAKNVGKDLELTLGLTHPVLYKVPEGIEIIIDKELDLKVVGIKKELVGQVAAEIRDYKKPEPYKGKGIRYKGEFVRRKAGKTASK